MQELSEVTRQYIRGLSDEYLRRMLMEDPRARPQRTLLYRLRAYLARALRGPDVPTPAPATPPQPRPMSWAEFPKGDWQYLVGKRIEHLVLAAPPSEFDPRVQAFLVFDNGFTFEIWGRFSGNNQAHREDLALVLRGINPATRSVVFGPHPHNKPFARG